MSVAIFQVSSATMYNKILDRLLKKDSISQFCGSRIGFH
eukprot:SAG31_NODE_5662_length_2397_cov_1.448651_1_plen_38_part_10